ncbi:MAG: hypothetical protein V4623_06245 [Pseudomonadota bacterium]
MQLNCYGGSLELINEPSYSFGSADNLRQYVFAKHLDGAYRPISVHGVLLNGKPLAVFGDGGGRSGVHPRSAVLSRAQLFLAVGRHVVCLRPEPFEFRWALQTDDATCFGVYYDETHDALISHGELEIARFTHDGSNVCSSSGADIFSEGFTLGSQYIEVRDFEGRPYRFNYADGKCCT